MSADTPSTQVLFESWRRGDAQSGQVMAQRFTDWFFAIASTHSGETQGRQGFQAACERFSQGVAAVPDPRRLGPWAQNVAKELIYAGRPPLDDGDFPGAYTRNGSPKELLRAAREALPQELDLLDAAYRGVAPDDAFIILNARYKLKSWLHKTYDLPFRHVPEAIDRDLNPLPFYEAGKMKTKEEAVRFELFLLDEPALVQDVAEFAHFAIALRGGLEDGAPPAVVDTGTGVPKATVTRSTRRPTAAPTEPSPPPAPPAPAAPSNDLAKYVPLLGGLVVVLLLAVVFLGYLALG